MAKKNSTKTATKEAMQASVPKLQAYQKWQGIKLDEKPTEWNAESSSRQEDLAPNFWMVQNNLVCSPSGSVETRPEDLIICEAPDGCKFTGVAYMWKNYIFAAFDDNSIARFNLDCPSDGWDDINIKCWYQKINNDLTNGFSIENKTRTYLDEDTFGYWSSIYVYGVNYVETLICQTSLSPITKFNQLSDDLTVGNSNMFTADLNKSILTLENSPRISAPNSNDLSIICVNTIGDSVTDIFTTDPKKAVSSETFMFSYVNKYGMTEFDGTNPFGGIFQEHKTKMLTIGPANFTPSVCLQLKVDNIPPNLGIEAVAFYDCEDDSTNPIFIGMVNKNEFVYNEDSDTYTAAYNWLGSMADTDEWENANLSPDGVNTTLGCNGSYLSQVDGRIYVWGDNNKPYRLGILGNPKNELSYSIGMGAGFLDIEPGTGLEITSVLKFKTASGASIVTILSHHPNTRLTKRYNLIETNITVTQDIAEQSWSYEEVANVIGSNSVYGSGVWEDGLYCLGRYGLGITTMAMEYNSQIKTQYISQNIDPVFDENFGEMINNARMIHVKDKTYFVFAQSDSRYVYTASDSTEYSDKIVNTVLEPIIFCYDHGLQAWYTFSYEANPIKHLMNIDYEADNEGIGIICEDHIAMIPMSGPAPYWLEKAKRTSAYAIYQASIPEYKNYIFKMDKWIKAKQDFDLSQAGRDKKKLWTLSDEYRTIMASDYLNSYALDFMRNPCNETYNELLIIADNKIRGNKESNWKNTIEYKAYESQEKIQIETLLETGELATSVPGVTQDYIAQLEFRFDYFIGDMDIELEGYDYYGRRVYVHKHIHRDELDYGTVEWMRVNYLLENYHLTIKAKAHYRLITIISKHYVQSSTINLPYGYDSSASYKNRLGSDSYTRHYLKNYNNLKDTIIT